MKEVPQMSNNTPTPSDNPHEPVSRTAQSEPSAPQAQSADETPSPKPSEGIRVRVMVNGK
jgi:hypothetical protein